MQVPNSELFWLTKLFYVISNAHFRKENQENHAVEGHVNNEASGKEAVHTRQKRIAMVDTFMSEPIDMTPMGHQVHAPRQEDVPVQTSLQDPPASMTSVDLDMFAPRNEEETVETSMNETPNGMVIAAVEVHFGHDEVNDTSDTLYSPAA